MQRSTAVVLLLAAISIVATAQQTTVVKHHDGRPVRAAQPRSGWEESIILYPQAPCWLKKIRVYYGAGGGTDTIRITGDAAEGTIPPTQYCFAYNTLAKVQVSVADTGWKEIDLSEFSVQIGGYDRIVVQHLMQSNGPVWAQDASHNRAGSFLYDPITPNPNFYNLPGIFYTASGDFLVELEVEFLHDQRPPPTFTDITSIAGLLNPNGSTLISDLVSVADIDNDGLDDIIVGNTLFRNSMGAALERTPLPFSASNTVWADFNGDGLLDCFAVNGNGNDRLYRNDGNMVFTDVTQVSGYSNNAPTVTPLFFDADNDGDADLFIANGRREENGSEVYYQDKLFLNTGNGLFTNVTEQSAIQTAEPAPYHDCWGASLADVNNDGFTDVFVATYRLAPDRLYMNNNGTLEERSQATGVIGIPTASPGYFGHGMGSDWADLNNDGAIDVIVGNLGHPDQRGQYSNPSLVLLHNGNQQNVRFENHYQLQQNGSLRWHGISFREMNAGVCTGDFDLDGDIDVIHSQLSYDMYGKGADRLTRLYMQESSNPLRTFVDRTWESGLFSHGSWTAVRLDFDRDGDLDLVLASGRHEVRLYRNDIPTSGNAITIRLNGDGASGIEPNGYGAIVYCYADGKQYMRQMPGTITGGRCSQMTHDLHFGLGAAQKIDSVVVLWRPTKRVRYTGLPLNSYVALTPDGASHTPVVGALRQVAPPHHACAVATQPTFRWSGADQADVQVCADPDCNEVIINMVNTTTSSTVAEELENGKTYYWRIRKSSTQPAAPWSSIWAFTVGNPAPGTVTVVHPTADATGVSTKAIIRWTPASFAAWGTHTAIYDVEVAHDGNVVCSVLGIQDTTTECNLDPLTEYTVRVRARTEYPSVGSWSEPISFTTYGTPGPTSLLQPEHQATNQPIRPRFIWQKIPWVDKGYEIEYDTIETFTTSTIRERPDTFLVVLSALRQQQTYYWRVRGINEAGKGAWSDVWSFSVAGAVSVQEHHSSPLHLRKELYDVLGRRIINEWLTRGPFIELLIDERGSIVQRRVRTSPD